MIKRITAKNACELSQEFYDTSLERRLNWIYERIEDCARRGFGGFIFSNEGYSDNFNNKIIADLEKAGYVFEERNAKLHTYVCWWNKNLNIGS